MRKFFVFVVVGLFVFTLLLPAAATDYATNPSVSYDTDDIRSEFTNFLKDAIFTVSCYDDESNLITKFVTADPFVTLEYGAYHIFFEWTPSTFTYTDHIFMSYQRYNNNSMRFFVNGINTPVNANNSGATVPTNYYYGVYTYVKSMHVEFYSSSPMYTVGIVSALGTPKSEFAVSSGTFSIDCSVGVYNGDTFVGDTVRLQSPTTTDFQIQETWNSTVLGYSLLSSTVNFVVPIDPLQSDQIDYFRLVFCSYSDDPEVSAYISSTEDPIYMLTPSNKDIKALNVKLTNLSTDIVAPSDYFAIELPAYEVKIDTSDYNLRKQYLHISFYFSSLENDIDYVREAGFMCNGISYYHDMSNETSIFSKIAVYLYEMRESLVASGSSIEDVVVRLDAFYDLVFEFLNDFENPDYSTALETLISNSSVTNSLLDEILLAIINQPDSSADIQEILSVLLSVDQTIGGIKSWLDNFDGFGYDFNTSINHVYNSYETLEDQLAILETVPKTERNEYGDVLLQIGSNVNTYLAESPLYDSSYDPSSPQAITTPLTFTTPLTAFYSGNIGSMIGTLLVVVISIALIGYVLFGKRGG